MQRHIDARIVPGVLTVVARHGRIVHFQAQGQMDIEAGKPAKDDTIFRIMSMTKPISTRLDSPTSIASSTTWWRVQ